jgi:hypothetical protein
MSKKKWSVGGAYVPPEFTPERFAEKLSPVGPPPCPLDVPPPAAPQSLEPEATALPPKTAVTDH